MPESKIRLNVVHQGADSATNCLFFDLQAAGFKTTAGIAYENSGTGKERGVMRVEIENTKAAVKALKTWLKASRFNAKVAL